MLVVGKGGKINSFVCRPMRKLPCMCMRLVPFNKASHFPPPNICIVNWVPVVYSHLLAAVQPVGVERCPSPDGFQTNVLKIFSAIWSENRRHMGERLVWSRPASVLTHSHSDQSVQSVLPSVSIEVIAWLLNRQVVYFILLFQAITALKYDSINISDQHLFSSPCLNEGQKGPSE